MHIIKTQSVPPRRPASDAKWLIKSPPTLGKKVLVNAVNFRKDPFCACLMLTLLGGVVGWLLPTSGGSFNPISFLILRCRFSWLLFFSAELASPVSLNASLNLPLLLLYFPTAASTLQHPLGNNLFAWVSDDAVKYSYLALRKKSLNTFYFYLPWSISVI